MDEPMETDRSTSDGVEPQEGSTSGRGKFLLFALAIVALLILSQVVDVRGTFVNAMDHVKGLGWMGYVLFAALYVAATVLFLAPTVLTLGAGAVYGVVGGTLLVSVSSMIGACTAFLLGRYFARDAIASKVEGNAKFKAIDDAVRQQGWKIVGLTRLSPLFPFSLLNYMYGLTPVSFRHFFFASWVGMLPGTIMYVYLGTAGESLVTLGAEGREKTTAEWTLLGAGLIVTIVVTLFVTRIAQKALTHAVAPEDNESTA